MFPSSRLSATPCVRRSPLVVVAVVAASAASILAIGQSVTAGIVPTVQLASAGDYSVLAATTVTNTNPSVLGQSVGLSPGTSVVGFPPGIVLAPATIEAANAVTLQAQEDLTTAYVDAAGRSVEFTQTNPDLVGQTLIPGVYAATARAPLGLSGELVLDGQGDPSAVFIFQTDSTLITSSSSTITLINGASECNVFWQVGSSATLGSGSFFVGTVLALTSVTVESSAVVHGRVLARNGAVELDNNVFTQPSCTPTPTTSSTAPTTMMATTTIATTTTVAADGPGTTTLPPGDTAGSTSAPSSTIGNTTPATATATTFGPPRSTLPATGVTVVSTTGILAVVALLLGVVAAFVARRRQPV